jgi:phosphopantetheinyl transferase (holo-ACP synthase)
MIGNDIVDLDLARKESNWKRKGFLDKIFSLQEQHLILNNADPELMVWNLWSRKEAAYKIYNRQTGIKGYFPQRLKCHYKDGIYGMVSIDNFVFYTQTLITAEYIYSIAVAEIPLFGKIKSLESLENIKKKNGIPYILDSDLHIISPASITHHGRFQRIITVGY